MTCELKFRRVLFRSGCAGDRGSVAGSDLRRTHTDRGHGDRGRDRGPPRGGRAARAPRGARGREGQRGGRDGWEVGSEAWGERAAIRGSEVWRSEWTQ